MRRRTFLLWSGAAAGLAACTSPNPSLYTMAAVPGRSLPGGPRIVLLHQVAVARYLERPEIVRSSEDYRLDVLANDVWGEPIAQMIGRVLSENLTQRLPGTTVISSNGAISAPENATVEVNIQRMDKDRSGALVFDAQAAVEFTRSDRGEVTRNLHTSVPITSPATGDEVRATSIALGQLADLIADMLRRPIAAS